MKRSFFRGGALAVALALLSVTACSDDGGAGDAGGETALTYAWWGGAARNDLQSTVVKQYTDAHPGVTIEAQTAEHAPHFERLTVQASGRNLPDIVQMQDRFLGQFAKGTVLADLTPYIEDGTIDVSGIDEAILNQGKVDGKQLMIPTSTSYRALMYDAKIFADANVPEPNPETTWDELADNAIAVAKAGKLPDRNWAMLDFCDYDVAFAEFLFAHGADPFADAKISFTADQAATWFTYWKELRDGGALPPPEVQTEEQGGTAEDSMFTKGMAGVVSAPSNQFTVFGKRSDTARMTSMPLGPAGAGHRFVVSGHSIASNSEHPDEAARYINFFLNDEQANLTYKADNGVPASAAGRKAVLEETQLEFLKLYETIRPTIRPSSPVPASASKLVTVLPRLCQEVAYGQMSPAQAADGLLDQL